MYNRDIITILLRDPDFSKLQSGTEDKIREEFKRLFGQELPENQEGEEVEPEALSEDEEPAETETTEESKSEKNVTVDLQVGKNEREEDNQVGKGKDYGRQKETLIGADLPLDFDTHLKELDHEQCEMSDYPDLSLSREDRLRLTRD